MAPASPLLPAGPSSGAPRHLVSLPPAPGRAVPERNGGAGWGAHGCQPPPAGFFWKKRLQAEAEGM